MRRIILVLLLSFVAMIMKAQQNLPEEFFGLKFGEKYTVEQMKAAVGDKGSYFEIDNSEPYDFGGTPYYRYGFEDVTYKGRTYPLMLLLTLKNGKLALVDFSYPNDTGNISALDSTYTVIKNELSEAYDITSFPIVDHPEIERLIAINNGVTVRLDKYTENGHTSGIEVSYVSLTATISDAFQSLRPIIQDSFFGMKMGSPQTRRTITDAVGHKGTYLDEEYSSNGKIIIFKNVSFAGRTWDFANFYLPESGQFYELRVNQSLNDGVIYEDEIRDAQKTYDYYKEKLNEKYGEKEEKDSDDGKYIIYLGSNDMGVILSNERSRSKGGDYRRYVTLDYIQTEINRKQSAKSEDDL